MSLFHVFNMLRGTEKKKCKEDPSQNSRGENFEKKHIG